MSGKTLLNRSLQAALVAAATFHAGGASAVDFQIGENTLKVENLFTIGASWRMQDIDPSLIGKSSLYRMRNPITANGTPAGLCLTRASDDGVNGPGTSTRNNTADNGTYTAGVIGRGCTTSDDTATPSENRSEANLQYVAAPGSFSPNGDDGDQNFEKGDLVHAIAKLTSDISFSFHDYNFFVRPVYYFDANYANDFETNYADTTLQARHNALPPGTIDQVGNNLQVLDYNVSKIFTVMDHDINVKVGNQVVNWGESSLLFFNSLNTVNVPDATKLRLPGLDLKELFQPQGMVVVGTDVFENVSVEGWYQYEWKRLIVDPPGTYFSQSDTLGEGGRYAMLSFGKVPDDPEGIYEAVDAGPSVDTTAALGSHSSRTIYRDFEMERGEEAVKLHGGGTKRIGRPDDDGQYGAKLQLFLENFNNGTELAFYYANYHSRFPIASLIAANDTCLPNLAACGIVPGVTATTEPLPVDTAKLVVEYPEDIHLVGTSFNTTVGDYAISGEYAYRDNLPTQIHTTDLTLAALNPAFPAADLGPVGGRRDAVPDFVSVYRGVTTGGIYGYGANEYIPGYERLKTGQANLSILRLIGGDNPIGASQMTVLLEMGMNQVFDMPGLHELQFSGGGTDTHISAGADCNSSAADYPDCLGINPADWSEASAVPGQRQNPTNHKDLDGFGSDESYGYRILNLNRWDSAMFGANLETLTIIQHDVKGTTPGIGTNFLQGRKQYAFGIRIDYLSTYIGEVRYSWNTGGAHRDGLRDRDNIQVSFGIQF
jgi:hypothetical protein